MDKKKLLTKEEMRQIVKDACRKAGGVPRFAEKLEVSRQLIHGMVKYYYPVSNTVALDLGYEKVTMYQPVKE